MLDAINILAPFSKFSHGKYGRQIFAAFAANTGAFSYGTAWAYTVTALPGMRQDIEFTPSSEALITSLLFLGFIIASPINGFCIDKFGRRMTMMLTNIPTVLAWILIGLSNDIYSIYIGRLITGICSASYGSAAPLFVSEISSAEIRGRLVCSFDSMIAGGMVFINIVGSFTSWRTQAFVCAVIPIIAHLMLWVCKESPRFIMQNGKNIEALETLKWYRNNHTPEELNKSFEMIKIATEEDNHRQKMYGWWVVLEWDVVKPILLCIMLMFFHLYCGNYPILAYGVGDDSNFLGITLINAAQFAFSIIPVFFVDSIGRRPLLIASELMMSLCLLSLGFVLLFTSDPGSQKTFTIYTLIAYEIFYSLGMGPIPWLLLGELVSPKKAGFSLAIVTGFYRIGGFLELYYFPQAVEFFGGCAVMFIVFGCICLVGAVLIGLFIQDTTGLELEELRRKDERAKDILSA